MKRYLVKFLFACSALFFVGTAFFLIKKSQVDAETYATSKPFITSIVKKSVFGGKVVPRKEIEVKSQITGVVEKIFVVAGDYVKKGDYIAEVKLTPGAYQIAMIDAQLRMDKINFRSAEIEYKHQLNLFEEHLISESEYNKFLLNYSLLKEAVESDEHIKSLLMSGESNGGSIPNNMIAATISGMVLEIPVKEGSYIVESSTFGASTTIASLADMNDIVFEGSVEESLVSKLEKGMEVNLKIGTFKDERYTANLEFIAPKGTTENGVNKFKVRASVKSNHKSFIRENYGAEAEIILGRKDEVLAINEKNLIIEDNLSYVMIETLNNIFEKRVVKTGLSDGINVEILSGLSIDDKIKDI